MQNIQNTQNLQDITYIKHCFYINLDYRTDRKKHVLEQMAKLNIPCMRFNAIKLTDGAIGCSMSHLKCLQTAKNNNWDHVMIIEDDITFLKPNLFIKQFNKFLKNNIKWDVILIAGNNLPPYQILEDNNSAIKVSHCQTTTGYIVKCHYYDILIENIKTGINLLMKEPYNKISYAIDKYWIHLQKKDNWYLITPPTVIQRDDYSDIEKRNTSYAQLMTDLDKNYLKIK